MNIRISLLSVVVLTMSVYAAAQSARNPLNHEPARVTLQKRVSSWNLSEETFYRADGTPIDKRSFVYDNNGRRTSNAVQRWKEGAWQNSSKNDYSSEGNKNIIITSVENMTGWQNTTKVENVYNSERKQIYSLSYSWDNSIDDWFLTPKLKCEWTYDQSGRMTEYLKKRFDKKANEWSVDARILYSYDEKGNFSEELYQSWDADSKLWINKGKYTYSNDNEMRKTAMSYYYVSDEWIFDGKIIYLYDIEGKLVRSEYYGAKPDESLRAYSLYTYSENKGAIISETADINVYPNPVVSSFELSVPESLVGKTASIFDIYGGFVKSVVVNSEKTQVNVNGISGGLYVLKIGDKTKKFIVK